MKYLLFGTGDYYKRYRKWFGKEDVLALLDNSTEKQNTMIDGIRVLAPEEGVKLSFDAIVILSFYVKAMKAQLVELGVNEACIFHFFQLRRLFAGNITHRPIQYYGNAETIVSEKCGSKKRILLLSHDMLLGGPSIALFHTARVLCEKGYEVVFASMLDGPLRQMLLDAHIPLVVDENLQIETMHEAGWTANFDLVICNTNQFYVFLSERPAEVPVLWWLHDSEFFYDGVDQTVMKSIQPDNLQICTVGPVPEAAIKKFIPDARVAMLNYGVEDSYLEGQRADRTGEKVQFVTIGFIEARKGQDILLEAIKELPSQIQERADFYLVGQNTSVLAADIMEEAKDIPQIHICGTVGRREINDILNRADALICPSREDPMPTVAAEAMMHEVPCCLSDVVGTVQYIQDGIDGIIFKSEDVNQLRDKIIWCVQHREDLPNMGKAARKVYEQYFSMEAHERALMGWICEKELL
jgi:glycosyltransferase involved in cell wall biosynthesis